jgi:integrase
MQADMVRLQLETGMRPGERVALRACDLDMTGKVWLYRPPQHKTQHHGHARVIALGPKAQAIVRNYLTTDLQAFLFSPRKNMEERGATQRTSRKSTRSSPRRLAGGRPARRRGRGTATTWPATGTSSQTP